MTHLAAAARHAEKLRKDICPPFDRQGLKALYTFTFDENAVTSQEPAPLVRRRSEEIGHKTYTHVRNSATLVLPFSHVMNETCRTSALSYFSFFLPLM